MEINYYFKKKLNLDRLSAEKAREYCNRGVTGTWGGIIFAGMEPIFFNIFFCLFCHFLNCFRVGGGMGITVGIGSTVDGNAPGGPSIKNASLSDKREFPIFQF